ncbi:MAG: Zn-ribbon domain-containing OB-fold protein [Anaerolineae bacterium]
MGDRGRDCDRGFTGAAFYEFLGEERLMGARCASCGALHVPPRALCPACFGGELDWEEMSGRGHLVAFTTVHIAPTAMIEAGYGRQNPYCAGIVQLAEGPAVSAQILGVDPARPEEIQIGTPLRVAFVRRGEGEQVRTYLAFEKE